jgi:hypothetical protein
MKVRLPILGAALALGMAVFSIAPAAAATSTSPQLTTAVTGTARDANGNVYNFAGSYTLDHVYAQKGHLYAVGTLSGSALDAAGKPVQSFGPTTVTSPLTADQTCTILDLTIGPISLNLLGLMVNTNTIHLTITAQQGPGNLLGNLLCAVAHLLDNTSGPAGALAALLNNIIAILNGL